MIDGGTPKSVIAMKLPSISSADRGRWLTSSWVWCLAAVVFITVRGLSQGFGELSTSLGDPDDALRLVEVRHWLEGASWFDMSLPRLGGATPLVSHWSRLIDVPLGLLLTGFGAVLSPADAELATRIVWPTLLLFLLLRLLARAAETQGGQAAAAIVLVLSLTCVTGLTQFRIGRIDHHNAMIAGTVGGLLLLLGARRDPREGTCAGVLLGLALAVGYEPLAVLVPALGAAALLGVLARGWLAGIRRMAVALSATLAVAGLLTVAPSQWLVSRCDALSLNMVLLGVCGAGGLVIVDERGRGWRVAGRIGALAVAGVIGAALCAAQDVRCLAGPFGQVDPALHVVWLDAVVEGVDIFTYAAVDPTVVYGFCVTMVLGLWAAVERYRRLGTHETMALLGLVVIAATSGATIYKITPYGSGVAQFAVALSLADVTATPRMTALSRRLVGMLAASQGAASALLAMVLAGSPAAAISSYEVDSGRCSTTAAVRALAALPKGLFVAPIDLGSYIVALTDHSALAAPYHRIDKAILAAHAILSAEPGDARRRLGEVGADYVAVCLPSASGSEMEPEPRALEARLMAGEPMPFLSAVPIASPVPELRVWRVVR